MRGRERKRERKQKERSERQKRERLLRDACVGDRERYRHTCRQRLGETQSERDRDWESGERQGRQWNETTDRERGKQKESRTRVRRIRRTIRNMCIRGRERERESKRESKRESESARVRDKVKIK